MNQAQIINAFNFLGFVGQFNQDGAIAFGISNSGFITYYANNNKLKITNHKQLSENANSITLHTKNLNEKDISKALLLVGHIK